MDYTQSTNGVGLPVILRTNDDGSVTWIPTDPANSDYQAYLAYVANGDQAPTSTVEPTSEPETSASEETTVTTSVTPNYSSQVGTGSN